MTDPDDLIAAGWREVSDDACQIHGWIRVAEANEPIRFISCTCPKN